MRASFPILLALVLLVPTLSVAAAPRPILELTLTRVEPPGPLGLPVAPGAGLGAFDWGDDVVVHVRVKNVGDGDSYAWTRVTIGTMLTGGAWRWTEGSVAVPVLAPGAQTNLTVSFSARGHIGDALVRATFGEPQLLSGQPLFLAARTPREALIHVLVNGQGSGTWLNVPALP